MLQEVLNLDVSVSPEKVIFTLYSIEKKGTYIFSNSHISQLGRNFSFDKYKEFILQYELPDILELTYSIIHTVEKCHINFARSVMIDEYLSTIDIKKILVPKVEKERIREEQLRKLTLFYSEYPYLESTSITHLSTKKDIISELYQLIPKYKLSYNNSTEFQSKMKRLNKKDLLSKLNKDAYEMLGHIANK